MAAIDLTILTPETLGKTRPLATIFWQRLPSKARFTFLAGLFVILILIIILISEGRTGLGLGMGGETHYIHSSKLSQPLKSGELAVSSKG
jgi:hypothetical protein